MPSIARKHAAAFQHDRTTGNDTWLTPKSLIDAFDMPHLADVDPCSPPKRPWPTAKRHITQVEDGLAHAWDPRDFYFVNPPYGAECAKWLRRAAGHGNGLALVFARTETRMFHECVWRHPNATAVLFFEGRLRFAKLDGTEVGSAGAPSVLVSYGDKACNALLRVARSGRVRGHLLLLEAGSARVYQLSRPGADPVPAVYTPQREAHRAAPTKTRRTKVSVPS
ncbi:DNA N-6-adenine-methyltransferase [Luteibacter sp. PPL554]